MVDYISADDFCTKLQNEDLDVLDIRTDLEFKAYRLKAPVQHCPLHDLDCEQIVSEHIEKNTPLYILCKAGPRAEKAAQLLEYYGLPHVIVVQGGMTGCLDQTECEKSEDTLSPDDLQAAVQESVQKFMARFAA